MITKLDFVGVPSTDSERSRVFYVDTLGLRPDPNARFEFWVGETCFGIWEPERIFGEFAPLRPARAGPQRRGRTGRLSAVVPTHL